MNRYIAETLNDLTEIAAAISDEYKKNQIFAFYGKMGSGKTTLIKEICRQKGVTGNITSPTFAIINEYITDKKEILYHFDFYRIETPEEVFDFGYEDYFFSGRICLIEWPELIENLLPGKYIKVTIEEKENGVRYISCNKVVN
ncbi:MAG: tRNA (adenosine(37)-N6)-threonylcarbamoyltransferase complex ATPase subunit type 1 TsaE [Bacteroidetes bacterium]|nr:MAG: tRNA (adenosine(37)-N6)-threonylcarbamoyltransferase complex ATPase subunit type 1 TsaE [Bacteroidota bacterium]